MRTLATGFALLSTLMLALAAGCSSSGAAGGEPSAASEPPAGMATPENTDWRLVDLGGQPARTAGNDAAPTLRLDSAENRASGNTGCNSFSGSYELSGSSLRFGPLATTRRACVDPEMNRQETAFLAALEATRGWRVTGNTLVLTGDAGTLARFVAQPAR